MDSTMWNNNHSGFSMSCDPLFPVKNITGDIYPLFNSFYLGKMLFFNGKPCNHTEMSSDLFREMCHIFIPYFLAFQILK